MFINDLSFHINYGEGRLISKLVNVHYTAGRAAGLAGAVVQFGAGSYWCLYNIQFNMAAAAMTAPEERNMKNLIRS